MTDQDLLGAAKSIGADWKGGPYYERAEHAIDLYWEALIWPLIKDCDLSCVIDLAAGHGRNTEILRRYAERVYVVDINEENIAYMMERFAGDTRIVYIQNDGVRLAAIPDNEATLVYSFDSMVHFDSDVVRAYLKEFYRVLRPGGYGFCHYSNNSSNPTGSYRDHPGWRNFMSRELFEHYAHKAGLVVIQSKLVDWLRDGTNCDAVTLFQKPQAE